MGGVAAQPAVGSIVSGYRIEAVIGRGGMGVVYRATQLELDRIVALKVIAPDLARDVGFRERFNRESRIAASLEHPHVVPVYEAGEHEGLLFIAMRYVDGTDLRALIAGRPLEPARAAAIVAQVASALDAAHARGLVHRDIKPANVLLSGAGHEHAYLADFGLTKLAESDSGLTVTGTLVGSIDYLSPEQIEHGTADARSDVYGLGCVLYEALTGSVPYPRENDAAKMWAHLKAEPPRVSETVLGAPPAFDEVVGRAMAKRPEERFASAGELGRAATAAAQGRSVAPEAVTSRAPPLLRSGPLVAAIVGVIAAAVSIPVFVLARGDSGARTGLDVTGGNVVVSIDPRTNSPADVVAAVGRPGDIVSGHGALWVTNADGPTVTRIDPATMRTDPIVTPAVPDVLAAGPDRIWFVSAIPTRETATVGAIHPRYRTVLPAVEVHGSPYGGGDGGIAVGRGAVWVVAGRVGRLSRLDARGQRVLEQIDAGTCCPSELAFGLGAVWVADPYVSAVTRIDARTRAVTTIPVGAGPNAIAAGPEGVWVTIGRDDEVARIDPATGTLRGHIGVGRRPVAVAVGGGSVWVANSGDGTVSRIDPATDRVVDTIEVGESPQGIAFAGGRVWVTLQSGALASAAEAAERRDVVRINAESGVESLDPAVAYTELSAATLSRAASSWQILYATCAKLVNYPDRPAPAGSRVVPEVARSLPTVSADGKAYTFTIRRGFRFSPPSNERVTAQTFKYSIERSLSPRINGPASLAMVTTATGARATLSELVGVDAYAAGRARHISGLVVGGDRLVVKLTRPVPDLLDRLALPFFCAVPTDTPVAPADARPIPSAGPYYVASYRPRQSIVLRRNPNYVGTRPHRPREIRVTIGPGKAQSVREIEAGRTDYALDGVPSDEQARLNARYGPGSAAARKDRQQYFVHPTLELWYVGLNTERPLFADVRMRKAANHAIDRQALVALVSTFFSAAPTDQYLPPGVRGFREARIYASRADVGAALQLVDERRGKAVLYSCPLLCAQPAREVQRMLGAIGIQVEIEELSFDALRQRLGTRGEPYDLIISAWSADYPDPALYLEPLFGLAEIHPAGSARGGVNVSLFDDPAYQRRLAAARRLSGARRDRAYGTLDVDLAREAAPMVALATTTRQDFFSARMGCQVYHPVYGMDLAALCVRR